MFWSKVNWLLSADKTSKCSEGAVCAWEYNGTLYKTKEDRDRAEAIRIRSRYRRSYLEHVAPMLQLSLLKSGVIFENSSSSSRWSTYRLAEDLAGFLFDNPAIIRDLSKELKEVIAK